MLSEKEIKHIAHLARIDIPKDKLDKLTRDISGILDFVGELSKVDTESIKESSNIRGLESILRGDKEHNLIEEKGQDLISQAPENKDGFVVVPEVLKQD